MLLPFSLNRKIQSKHSQVYLLEIFAFLATNPVHIEQNHASISRITKVRSKRKTDWPYRVVDDTGTASSYGSSSTDEPGTEITRHHHQDQESAMDHPDL